MSAYLLDTSPTTDAEKALFRSMPMGSRVVWCPLRHHQIDLVVCSRLQVDRRRQCFNANAGRGCRNLDSCAAEQLQKARRA